MILNIGDDSYILKEDIVAILGLDSMKEGHVFKEFIGDKLDLDGFDRGQVKSLIVLERDGEIEVRTSSISSKTLEKRYNLNRWR